MVSMYPTSNPNPQSYPISNIYERRYTIRWYLLDMSATLLAKMLLFPVTLWEFPGPVGGKNNFLLKKFYISWFTSIAAADQLSFLSPMNDI